MSERKNAFTYDELIASGHGELFGPGNAQLPLPPMMMFERIISITTEGGKYDKGQIVAEMDIREDQWFFACHFEGDPVMPGCLGLDAMWQMIGFFLAWSGGPGKGRALGVGEVKFSGQVTPGVSSVRYVVDLKRVIMRKLVLGIGDGEMFADGTSIYKASDLRVGLFQLDDLKKTEV